MPLPALISRRTAGVVLLLCSLLIAHADALAQPTSPYLWRTLTGQPGGTGNADGFGSAARFNGPGGVAADKAGNIYVADSVNNTIRQMASSGAVTTLAGAPGQFGSVDGMGSAALFDNPTGVAVDDAGNVYVADTDNGTIRKVTANGIVTTLAGNPGVFGIADGTNSAALFNYPRSVAVDGFGNIYVADSGNSTIRKVTPVGVVTTLAGLPGETGSDDGVGQTALFYYPCGLTLDGSGNVYVADTDNNAIRKVTTNGVVTTLAGNTSAAGTNDGAASVALFNTPYGLAADNAGDLYVADTGNNTIRVITAGGAVTTLAGNPGAQGFADGAGGMTLFRSPSAIAVFGPGQFCVADTGNSCLRVVEADGAVSTLAGSPAQHGHTDVIGAMARFSAPSGVAWDGANNVFVADQNNSTIRKVTVNGVVTTLAGAAGEAGAADGVGSSARFNHPLGVAVAASGVICVADSGNNTIRLITPCGAVATLAGAAGQTGAADGTGSAARFDNPTGLAVDASENIIVADYGNCAIRMVATNGAVTTLAGQPGVAGSADGTATNALFNHPSGVAVDAIGNIYVSDYGNSVIRRITPSRQVTTLAGLAGQPGSVGGLGAAARFNLPFGVAVGAGNIYVADMANFTIRQITTNGLITTLAGNSGRSGAADGLGSSAQFNLPCALAFAGAGNLYVADLGNDTIRQVTTNGVVTTLAGSAGVAGSSDITGAAARYSDPAAVALDGTGNLYVADFGNAVIRKVTPDGGVTTLAGAVENPGYADGVGTAAQFNQPAGMAVNSAGEVYVADQGNSVIRHIAPGGAVTTVAGVAGEPGSSDGLAAAAQFVSPSALALDNAGNLFVADSGASTIRKMDTNGMVTTLAGKPFQPGSADGSGLAAQFNLPSGLAVDASGNIYVADSGNSAIRKISSADAVTTLSANAFTFPRGIAVDASGNLFVADSSGETVGKISSAGAFSIIGGASGVIGGADGVGGAANFSSPSGLALDALGRIYVADAGNNRISLGVPIPSLSIKPSNGNLTVSWPSFVGFQLEQSSNLAPNSWSPVGRRATNNGLATSITIPPTPNPQFFRLSGQ